MFPPVFSPAIGFALFRQFCYMSHKCRVFNIKRVDDTRELKRITAMERNSALICVTWCFFCLVIEEINIHPYNFWKCEIVVHFSSVSITAISSFTDLLFVCSPFWIWNWGNIFIITWIYGPCVLPRVQLFLSCVLNFVILQGNSVLHMFCSIFILLFFKEKFLLHLFILLQIFYV